MLEFQTAVVVFCVLVGVVVTGLWLWYDRRDHRAFENVRRRSTFHCIRCDALYTAPAAAEMAPCPKCRHENARLKF